MEGKMEGGRARGRKRGMEGVSKRNWERETKGKRERVRGKVKNK